MPSWITPGRAEELVPGFFAARGENSWQVDANGRRISSRFGFAEVRVQTKPDGTPDFDRVVYGEAPNINAVIYGIGPYGTCHVAVTVQARPFADLPTGEPAETPIVFGQPCVMGFRQAFGGFNMTKVFEASVGAAAREAIEEAGAEGVLRVIPLGHHNPNPTFVASWSELFEIEVDLTKVTGQTDRSELIYRAEYVPLGELLQRIAHGEHNGVNYRSATANNALFVWLSSHPELLAQLV